MTKALLIDDDREFARDLAVLLPADVQLAHASGSCEGLALVESWNPEVVLVDLRMDPELAQTPEEEGLEVLRRLAAGGGARPRVIVISALLSPAVERECLARGAEMCLKKPVTAGGLLRALKGGEH